MTTTSIRDTLLSAPLRFTNEAQLQEQLQGALLAAGFPAERERPLSIPGTRIDILVGAVGIEVKVKGSLNDVLRQLSRYSRAGEIDELILVTTKAAHHRIPRTIGGKPLTLCSLVGVGL